MMASYVIGSLVQQVWPPLPYQIRCMEVSTSVGGLHKMLGWAIVCSPLHYSITQYVFKNGVIQNKVIMCGQNRLQK